MAKEKMLTFVKEHKKTLLLFGTGCVITSAVLLVYSLTRKNKVKTVIAVSDAMPLGDIPELISRMNEANGFIDNSTTAWLTVSYDEKNSI